MKKIFSLLVLWLCHIALFAQYGGAGGTFNPVNPDNPEPVGVRYGLHVVAQPEGAGTTNLNYSNEITAGSQTHLYAYPSKDYKFKEWTCDGQVLSTNQDFFFTMPEKDVTVTAVFAFSPENPGNPGANDWDVDTRTLIIDDFQTGSLSNAIYQMTGGQTGQVKTLIVKGNINNNDLGSLAAFTSMEVIDLSRCYGATTVPAWFFNSQTDSINANTALKEFSLPASITTIENNAFANCFALTSLNSYAVVPPALGADAFQNITKSLVVYVPENSVSAYKNADGWKDLNIQPLGTKVRALEVDLPEGSEGRYKNLFIELVNAENETQTMRYLITDAIAYTFNNLPRNTVWNAFVKNANGQILGSILGIEIGEKNLRVQFESLLEPQTISALVKTPDGSDVTDKVVITWLSENGSYLSQGTSISGILPVEGAKVTVRVALSEELILEYQTPEDVVYAVQLSDNVATVVLQAVDKITLTGKVVDEETKEGISGAIVVAGQTIYGRYTKSFSATTDANGEYIIQGAYDAPTNITATATDYTSKAASYDTLIVASGKASLGEIALKNLKSETNTRIQVSFLYKACAENVPKEFADSLNVAYYIWNLSQGMQQVTEFNVNGREIVLLENANVGDNLLITAISKTNAFAPQNAGCTVDASYQAKATFLILEPGQLKATYIATDAPAVTGILYDAAGKFVRSGDFEEASLLFTNLSTGVYTLVAMSRSSLFNSIYDLSKFSDFGLEKGVDYVANSVSVQDGIIMPTTFAYVPYLDESKLDFMGDQSSFTVNKTTVTAGNTLTLSASIDFKEIYAKDISDVKLVVDLDASNFVVGSVMVGGKVSDEYVLSGDQLVIPISNFSDRIRFCVKPLEARDYAPTASVQFVYNNRQMTKPIGQASFTAEKLSISVPATIDSEMIPVSGSSPARALIWIYDDNELIGLTMALANGTWSQQCQLQNPVNPSEHHIYAKVKSDNEEILTETRTVQYKQDVVVLDKVEMLNTAHPATSLNLKQYKTVFEFIKTQTRITPYWYWPDYPEFTFLIYYKQDKPYDPSQVELFVYTSNRKYRILKPTRYDTHKKAYVVTSRFYVDALPISVNVRKVGDPVPPAHKPYVEYVLDPSGYVYEGVPTNRLQGVTATIYYRPVGDEGPGTKWDAEGYGQENPVLTDEFGMYAWDVPEGEWKVIFEKAGYEPAESEWLPVPPPQLNVNIPMVQSTPPAVKSAKAYSDGVEIEFDKYMLSSSLTTDNILITCNNEVVAGTIELLNAEGSDENDENQQRYASRVKFNFPEGGVSKNQIFLMVYTNVESYAGLNMVEPYTQELQVELQVKEIVAEPVIAVEYEGDKSITVGALLADGSAAKGKSLRIRSLSTEIADIKDVEEDGSIICQLDENGQAEITVNGLLPGTAAIQYTIEETNAEDQVTILAKGQTIVNVTEKPLQTANPTASRITGAAVYRGTLVSLASESDDAKIYYTTTPDGDPSTLYSAPIAINDNQVTIKAYAKADGFEKSGTVTFNYSVLQNTVNLNLVDGWTWMSHNVADNQSVNDFPAGVVEIKGQSKGAVRDGQRGWFGNLSELVPSEGYKMKVSGTVDKKIAGDAFNASKGSISLAPGWNWIGYPMNQTMSLEEALFYLPASEGDIIVGLNGSAEYSKDPEVQDSPLTWRGDLVNLEPGKSYLLKTAVANDLHYNTTIISKAAAHAHGRLDINITPWSVDIHAYPNVMPVRLQIAREEGLTNDEFTVAAFCGTECRGIGKYVDGVIFMNVHGEGNENITFQAMHNEKEYLVDIQESLTFTEDAVGSYRAPYVLHLGSEYNSVQKLYSQFSVWPTMATTEITVSLGEKTIDRLTLTSIDGKTTYSASPNATQSKVNVTSLPAGVYIVSAKSGNEYFYQKIMKVN